MSGTTIYVSALQGSDGNGGQDSPFSSIQDAIDAFEPGDTIVVGAGTYNENLKITKDGTAEAPLTIVARDGPGSVIVRSVDATKDTVNIAGAENIVIDGLELHGIQGGSKQVVHIHARDDNTDPAANVVITNSTIVRGDGDGIKVSKSHDVVLEGNTILGGGPDESGIDLVGVQDAIISDNSILGTPKIGIMIKGGSENIDVIDNLIDGTGKNAIEIGGYTPTKFYPPGFLEDGKTFEASSVTMTGNTITDTGDTAIRVIGAVDVTLDDNDVVGAEKYLVIDDSSKFHDTWFADDITLGDNTFETADGSTVEDWLRDRSEEAEIKEIAIVEDVAGYKCVMPSNPDGRAVAQGRSDNDGSPSRIATEDEFVFKFDQKDGPQSEDPAAFDGDLSVIVRSDWSVEDRDMSVWADAMLDEEQSFQSEDIDLF